MATTIFFTPVAKKNPNSYLMLIHSPLRFALFSFAATRCRWLSRHVESRFRWAAGFIDELSVALGIFSINREVFVRARRQVDGCLCSRVERESQIALIYGKIPVGWEGGGAVSGYCVLLLSNRCEYFI